MYFSSIPKGYASEILKLTLIEVTKCGLSDILITCNEPNIASAKVIEKNDGVWEKSFHILAFQMWSDTILTVFEVKPVLCRLNQKYWRSAIQ